MNNIVENWHVKYRVNGGVWKDLVSVGDKHYWYADPMLFEKNGKVYLFTEAFDKRIQKGKLAVSYLTDSGEFSKPEIIINLPYHLSYPCVWEEEGCVYMLPETSQDRTLEIWKSKNDHLLKWERVGYLSRNVKYVDSTVLRIEDKTYIFCYTEENHHYATHIYRIEPKTLFMEEVFKESHQENIFRPAGNFFRNDEGKLIRPLQYNKKSYGEYIEFSEIESITPLKERIFKRVSVQDLRNQMGIKTDAENTHTYSVCNTVEIFDVLERVHSTPQKILFCIRKVRNAYFKLKHKEKIDGIEKLRRTKKND